MRALAITPGRAGSLRLAEIDEPARQADWLLARTLCIGVCGTDFEIAAGRYGEAAEGHAELIVGHESLGEVIEAPPGGSFAPGDLIVGIVRRPDPVPCPSCAVGEWDMCRNGRYTERGIKARDGYAAERIVVERDFAIRLDPGLRRVGVLVEPASVVAKAWEHTLRIGGRAHFEPRRVLVTGAGPIGLLAALFGVQRGYEVHVFDRAEQGIKPELVHALGGIYHTGELRKVPPPDILIECTGAAEVLALALSMTRAGGVTCLAGLSTGDHHVEFDVNMLGRSMVLENDVVFGSVNANRRHYEAAAAALARADGGWLERLIARRAPLDAWAEAFERRPGDVKTVIDFAS